MNSITFQSSKYKSREIQLSAFGDVLISTTSLNRNLFDKNDRYVNDEACVIDEQIFYFVEENEITLPEKSLKELLLKQIK